jgi:uncharacterized protein (TIGR03089 family)
VLAAFAAGEPSQPLLTFYDDATGERTELSRATMANWVAKTANLLVSGLGLGAGDVAAVRLPAHWQTAAVLLGCWSAGLCVDLGDASPPGPAAVAFVTAAGVGTVDADDVLALALAPLAAPLRPGPPPGAADYVLQVRGHGDHFTPVGAVRPDMAALCDGTSHADLVAANQVAAGQPVPAGARLLIDADAVHDPLRWLVAPLVAGASVVLCRHLDPARLPARLASERAVPFA